MEDIEAYLDQTDRFGGLRNFRSIEALSAEDLRGLDPDDVKFLVNAQMTGNEQQRLMFNQALSHMQMQQQRMDQAKTAVAKTKAAQELAKAQHQLRLIEDELQFKRDMLKEAAKSGDRRALEEYKHGLYMERLMLDKTIPNAKNEEDLRLADARARQIEQEIARIESGEFAEEEKGLTPYQQQMMEERRVKARDDAMMKIFDPKTPVAEKEYWVKRINQPDNTVYYKYQPFVDNWGPNNTPEELLEYPIPPNPQTGKQLTLKEIEAVARESGMTVLDVIEMLYAEQNRVGQ